MTSRERVRKALDHRTPDRVPIDFGGFQTGIHRKAYEALLAHLGIADERIVVLDPVQQLARPCEAVLKRFHVDTRYLGAHAPAGAQGGITRSRRDSRDWQDLEDQWGVVWSMPEDQQLFMDISHHPLADATVEDLSSYPFPKGNDPTRFTGVREDALRLRRESDAAICTTIGGVVYETCWYMRGLERWFMDMLENPRFCEAVLDRTLRYWLDFYTGFLAEVGDLVDVVMIGDDLAGQSGPLFSPDFYRSTVKPRQKRLVQHIRSLTNAKVWYHTCGSCAEYIPDLIDNGVDILNPVQISARNMEPRELKQRFGGRMVFWGGGVDCQRVLPFASPEEVRADVQKNLGAFMPEGGYVFNSVHNVQHGVPPQNIVAMFDAAYDNGFYTEADRAKRDIRW